MYTQSNSLLAWRILYWTYGIFPIVVGLDKFFNYIVNWDIYLHPAIPVTLGMSPVLCSQLSGVIEIAVGVIILCHPRIGGYMVCAWLLAIAVSLVLMGNYYDIAVRDVGLAVGALALALMSDKL